MRRDGSFAARYVHRVVDHAVPALGHVGLRDRGANGGPPAQIDGLRVEAMPWRRRNSAGPSEFGTVTETAAVDGREDSFMRTCECA